MPHTYWPGGIPSCIRTNEAPVDDKLLDEQTKGWHLYVQERWIPRTATYQDVGYEVEQRRELLCSWATATQEFRDEYQNRAPSFVWNWKSMAPYIHKNEDTCCNARRSFYICLASLKTPRNYALWTKLRVLSHRWYSIGSQTYENDPIVARGLSESSDSLSPEQLLIWNHVETANFNKMAMTVDGTVVFKDWENYVLADQRALETGMVLFTEVNNNGSLGHRFRVNILLLHWPLNLTVGLGKGLEELKMNNSLQDEDEGSLGPEIDMTLPLFDIFRNSFHLRPHVISRQSNLFLGQMVEHVAPGYLAAEAKGNGLTAEYDHTKFRET